MKKISHVYDCDKATTKVRKAYRPPSAPWARSRLLACCGPEGGSFSAISALLISESPADETLVSIDFNPADDVYLRDLFPSLSGLKRLVRSPRPQKLILIFSMLFKNDCSAVLTS
jgi:hypothetical protein